jgi:hypothetical protein
MRSGASRQVRRTSGEGYLTVHNRIRDRKPRKQPSQADGAWGSHCQPEAMPRLRLPAGVLTAPTSSCWQREDHLNEVTTR